MLTDAGRQVARVAADRLVEELTRHGGPWAAPVTIAGEITDPDSGLLRKKVHFDDDGLMNTVWEATDADDCRTVYGIGLAPTRDGVFLSVVPFPREVPQTLRPRETVRLHGPLDYTVS